MRQILPHTPLLRSLRAKARHLTFGTVVYNWSLGGAAPEEIAGLPADAWPGDAQAGRDLCERALDPDFIGPPGCPDFDCLRDLRALGGDEARRAARAILDRWLRANRFWDADSWAPGPTGRRVANWLALYTFYGVSADGEFQERLFESLGRQARHLSRALPSMAKGIDLLRGYQGLALAGLAFKGRESWLEQALDGLQVEAMRQILPDGGHISRSAAILLDAMRVFTDIRAGLAAHHYPVPDHLAHTIDRMAQALRFFRAPDKGFMLFNGATEGDPAAIEAALARVEAGGRILRELPQSGYQRVSLGRSLLMVDAGAPPPMPHDGFAHAAPLSFEFSYGKERLIVACGARPRDPAWNEALRGTAAHNTLVIDHRNAAEIRVDGHFARRPRKVTMTREDARDAILLDGSHDGYVPLNGVSHRRRLYLAGQGHDLRGEDRLICATGLSRPLDLAVRFHLHPKVQVVMLGNGEEALLRSSNGAGWRLSHAGGRLAIEDSVYCGDGGMPRKTKQLVIHGELTSDYALIKWALQREGG